MQLKPGRDPFFDKTHLIMMKEEIEIYKNLQDQESRVIFQEDFWQRRDPDPFTEENEFKKEFEGRVSYANRWFRESRAIGRGWDTERGRILLVLGIPNKREWGNFVNSQAYYDYIDPTGNRPKSLEVWYYDDYNLILAFADYQGFGDFRLATYPAQLGSDMELAKASYQIQGNLKGKRLTFDADYSDGKLTLAIPVNRINFESVQDNNMESKFLITVIIYQNFRKLDTQKREHLIREKESTFLNQKKWEISTPIPLETQGKFLLDITLTDLKSNSSYRRFLKVNL